MVAILLSFLDGLFSGAMLDFWGVINRKSEFGIMKKLKKLRIEIRDIWRSVQYTKRSSSRTLRQACKVGCVNPFLTKPV